ncbi:MAG: hypothetical protein PHH25_09240 [Bacteroidales bacterium]|nr:hypothetical protein [Bacteroidales bacterium]
MISQQSYYTSYYNGSSFGALKYTYCANNPMKFVDPTGRDLEISGDESKAAFKEYKIGAKQHGVSVKMDKHGVVSARYTGKGPMSDEAQEILNIVNDKSVKVKINATSSNTTEGGAPFVGGAFLGSTLTSANSAEARQDVNPADLKKMSDYYGKPGQDMLHEVSEAYLGGKMAIITGSNICNSIEDKPTFEGIHYSAISQQSGDLHYGDITKMGLPSEYDTVVGKRGYVMSPEKQPMIIKDVYFK